MFAYMCHLTVCVCMCVSIFVCVWHILMYVLCTGNHRLAIFKESGAHVCMQACLSDIKQEMESLKSITINYLGGDWRFLTMATGIDSATSTFTYIWCKCPTDQRANMRKWSITDTDQGARTIEENIRLANQSTSKFNVFNTPLFISSSHPSGGG